MGAPTFAVLSCLRALGTPSRATALEALHAYPGGLQMGGGVTAANASEYLDAGASHVIVTSYVFREGRLDEERLQELVGGSGAVVWGTCLRIKSRAEQHSVTARHRCPTEPAPHFAIPKCYTSQADQGSLPSSPLFPSQTHTSPWKHTPRCAWWAGSAWFWT
jgi:hypothetical protein